MDYVHEIHDIYFPGASTFAVNAINGVEGSITISKVLSDEHVEHIVNTLLDFISRSGKIPKFLVVDAGRNTYLLDTAEKKRQNLLLFKNIITPLDQLEAGEKVDIIVVANAREADVAEKITDFIKADTRILLVGKADSYATNQSLVQKFQTVIRQQIRAAV